MTRRDYNPSNMTTEQRKAANEIHWGYINQVKEIAAKQITGYEKLTEKQQEALNRLAMDMFEHHIGEDYIANHYEIFHNSCAGDPQYKKYRDDEDNNIYLATGISSTFRALEKRGFIKYLEDGGKYIDRISPNFQLDFSSIQLKEVGA